MGALSMRHGVWLRMCFACAMVSEALPAQTAAAPVDYSDYSGVPTAEVRLQPSPRGDLSVHLYTWDLPDPVPDRIPGASLACDWRPEEKSPHSLSGKCRRYLRSDGSSVEGVVTLAPLVSALRRAGARNVLLELSDYGTPLAAPPPEWHVHKPAVKHFGPAGGKTYAFWSLSPGQLPQPFEIRVGTPWSASRVAVPFVCTLFAPALLALWLRRRAERKGQVEAASVWVYWILTGMWLYWISALSETDLAALASRLQFDSMSVTLLIGTFLFAGPPLASAASCVAILLRAPKGERQTGGIGGLVFRSVAREGVLMIPLGMFIVGSGMFTEDWRVATASLPAAWFTWKLLSWWVSRSVIGGMEALSHGPLADAAGLLARRAGVKLGGLYMIGNRSPQEANAFAAGGNRLAMTRGLVENLTCRELVAVMGHEVGHLRGKHVATRLAAFWGYMLLVGPAAAWVVGRYHLPPWLLSLPLLPLAYILATAFLSRNHEFSADAQAVDLARDPEGMIAALSRLRKLSRTPVDWGGIQGSILSHPSMRDRVLAIARRFQLPEERALALLDNPDLLSAGTPPDQLHFSLPPECANDKLVFTSGWRHTYALCAQWLGYVALAAIALGVGQCLLMGLFMAPRYVRPLLLLAPLPVGWGYLAFLGVLDRLSMRRLRRKLRRARAALSGGGMFVGLLPGGPACPVEGFCLWDAGFLFLSPDSLTYLGERAGFTLARAEVTGISVGKGPLAWDRDYAVVISCDGGCFSLTRPDRGASRRQARRLERRLRAWWTGALIEPTPTLAMAPPLDRALLHAPSTYLRGWRAIRIVGLRAVLMTIGISMLFPFTMLQKTPAVAFVPLLAPAGYIAASFPLFLRRKPRAARPAGRPAPQFEPVPQTIG